MPVKLVMCFTTAESRMKIWLVKLITPSPHNPSPVASAAVRSKAEVPLLFIHCLLLLPLFVGV